MYAKNSLMGTNSYEFDKKYKGLIDIFASAQNAGINKISMPYLLKNIKIKQKDLYDQIHLLLELNILDMDEYSVCPYCGKEDKYSEDIKLRCSKCKQVYIPNNIKEKFSLRK